MFVFIVVIIQVLAGHMFMRALMWVHLYVLL